MVDNDQSGLFISMVMALSRVMSPSPSLVHIVSWAEFNTSFIRGLMLRTAAYIACCWLRSSWGDYRSSVGSALSFWSTGLSGSIPGAPCLHNLGTASHIIRAPPISGRVLGPIYPMCSQRWPEAPIRPLLGSVIGPQRQAVGSSQLASRPRSWTSQAGCVLINHTSW